MGIIGIVPIRILIKKFLFLMKLNISFLKYNIIAISDPRCKQISINKFWFTKVKYFEIKTKLANELTGKNSEIPWIADKIKISTEDSIKYYYCIAVMQYKLQICLIFLIISQLYCPINAFSLVYIDIKGI